jgi:hypothetical protein
MCANIPPPPPYALTVWYTVTGMPLTFQMLSLLYIVTSSKMILNSELE